LVIRKGHGSLAPFGSGRVWKGTGRDVVTQVKEQVEIFEASSPVFDSMEHTFEPTRPFPTWSALSTGFM
jgi:hypothetical protein